MSVFRLILYDLLHTHTHHFGHGGGSAHAPTHNVFKDNMGKLKGKISQSLSAKNTFLIKSFFSGPIWHTQM